ncbi:ribosomal protein S18 acetylase RimI-like enzyme [Ensifer sp. KUDG1]
MTTSDTMPLVDFPVRTVPARITVAGLSLRHATSEDVPFLLELYRSFRADELAPVPWPPERKLAFLDQQFLFQHRHYMATFADADYLVAEAESQPIGRVYLDWNKDRWLIVDIGFLPQWRRQGLGTRLIAAIQQQAALAAATAISLHVEQHNFRAQALYYRLGFRAVENGPSHVRMEWPCSNHAEAGDR